ncbi:uncharacterized protein MELLADRAFT_106864 [Melampsora larici-populina 98AG31]|uniref:Uncharacterized protein n=1 Tax=Melampsora larici-populina (strain 98AG31 / pathotype 3-4-7) TaxID=747676 RepID=F4RMW7_MELLP|nr:uncharacterized protein MELLADRAFT_106864 [Melampsora larici-populina 98AG31]EGG06186.1 hypothetical protein MELLADRAFT_106864 [Melampsora larici-populina 98AG31]
MFMDQSPYNWHQYNLLKDTSSFKVNKTLVVVGFHCGRIMSDCGYASDQWANGSQSYCRTPSPGRQNIWSSNHLKPLQDVEDIMPDVQRLDLDKKIDSEVYDSWLDSVCKGIERLTNKADYLLQPPPVLGSIQDVIDDQCAYAILKQSVDPCHFIDHLRTVAMWHIINSLATISNVIMSLLIQIKGPFL